MSVRIFHNPRCSKSRACLGLLNDQGVNPEIVEYLKENPSFQELKDIIQKLNIKPLDLIRKGEKIYTEKYKGKDLKANEWIQAMIENPILIERPIVINGDRAIIGRPPETVLSIIKDLQ